MVTQHDDFIGNGPVDYPNNIPHRRCYILLFINEVENKILRGRSDVIFNAFILKTSFMPIFVEGVSSRTVAVESFK